MMTMHGKGVAGGRVLLWIVVISIDVVVTRGQWRRRHDYEDRKEENGGVLPSEPAPAADAVCCCSGHYFRTTLVIRLFIVC